MAELLFRNVSKSYGDIEVVSGFNLEVMNQEFIVLLGPSGCGKATILRMHQRLKTTTVRLKAGAPSHGENELNRSCAASAVREASSHRGVFGLPELAVQAAIILQIAGRG